MFSDVRNGFPVRTGIGTERVIEELRRSRPVEDSSHIGCLVVAPGGYGVGLSRAPSSYVLSIGVKELAWMGHQVAPLSYEELLATFKEALNRVLTGALLPPTCVTFDLPLTLSLLDVADAVRQGRRTQGLVTRACGAFADYAAGKHGVRRLSGVAQSKLVT